MKSNISHVLMFIGAILAFTPIVAVDFVIDAYARHREKVIVEQYVAAEGANLAASLNDAVQAMRQVLAESPSLCAQTFVDKTRDAIQRYVGIKQFVVENGDGVQYCDAYGRDYVYSPLSPVLPIPGQSETVVMVQPEAADVPSLKVTQAFGDMRYVSVFVPLLANNVAAKLQTLPHAATVRISITNNQPIMILGGDGVFPEETHPDDYVYAVGYAAQYPIKFEVIVPFAMARAQYADLDALFTVLASLLSATVLIVSLQFVRRSRVPGFNLERAIERNEIKPYYQPVINLRTGELVGCEVLCRWEKRNGRMVPPNAFIEYAENSGLAIPMTVSLMQQVRVDLEELCVTIPDLKISINLFEGHFRDGGIVEDVQAIFSNSSISFRQLVFEITERRPLRNTLVATSVISGLHALGSRLAMDDVGTGHSNLAYLATLGVDVIKIDRIFVDMIKPETTQVPVLDGLIAMGKDLDCEIVAEGVETEEQALYLRSHGVVHAQGYIFAPALKASVFKELAMALHSSGGNARDVLASVTTAD